MNMYHIYNGFHFDNADSVEEAIYLFLQYYTRETKKESLTTNPSPDVMNVLDDNNNQIDKLSITYEYNREQNILHITLTSKNTGEIYKFEGIPE